MEAHRAKTRQRRGLVTIAVLAEASPTMVKGKTDFVDARTEYGLEELKLLIALNLRDLLDLFKLKITVCELQGLEHTAFRAGLVVMGFKILNVERKHGHTLLSQMNLRLSGANAAAQLAVFFSYCDNQLPYRLGLDI